jgi:thiamine pyrophosphate-dependent acetolactate synthase large subunit-like protein
MRLPAANHLARILQAEGVPWVSTFPVCCVNNALGQEAMPLIMMRDERYAVGVADAFSRVTNGKQIGVCTVMGGANPVGVQMAYGALAQAFEDGSPVLCITDGVPLGAGGTAQYDMTAGLKAITKWIGHIDQPQRTPEFMRRAFTYLRSGQPGPVVITMPRNIGEYDDEQYPYTPVKGWRTSPAPEDIEAAVALLRQAKRPLIYLGEGIFYANALEELRQFAELAQAPVLASLKANSALPADHPLWLGTRGELATEALNSCDMVLAFGASLTPGHFAQTIPDAAHKVIVHNTLNERDVNKAYPTRVALLGDAKLALQGLIAGLGDALPPRTAWFESLATAKAAMWAKYTPLLESNDTPINPYRVYGDLMKTMDPLNSCVTPDSGNTRDQTSTVWQARVPHAYLGWGNVTTLGYGLAMAIGAKLAYPQRQCVNITGDAGVGYMLGNLEALVRLKIGVTTVHINNGGFAGYGEGFWGQGHDPFTCDVSEHEVADLSEAVKHLGYYAEHVTDPAEIVPAIRRALDVNAHGTPAYLEFICSKYPVYGNWVTG